MPTPRSLAQNREGALIPPNSCTLASATTSSHEACPTPPCGPEQAKTPLGSRILPLPVLQLSAIPAFPARPSSSLAISSHFTSGELLLDVPSPNPLRAWRDNLSFEELRHSIEAERLPSGPMPPVQGAVHRSEEEASTDGKEPKKILSHSRATTPSQPEHNTRDLLPTTPRTFPSTVSGGTNAAVAFHSAAAVHGGKVGDDLDTAMTRIKDAMDKSEPMSNGAKPKNTRIGRRQKKSEPRRNDPGATSTSKNAAETKSKSKSRSKSIAHHKKKNKASNEPERIKKQLAAAEAAKVALHKALLEMTKEKEQALLEAGRTARKLKLLETRIKVKELERVAQSAAAQRRGITLEVYLQQRKGKGKRGKVKSEKGVVKREKPESE